MQHWTTFKWLSVKLHKDHHFDYMYQSYKATLDKHYQIVLVTYYIVDLEILEV